MSEFTYQDAIDDFHRLFNLTIDSRLPVKVSDPEGKSVYMVSEDDFKSMEETFYLLKNPYNASHVIGSVNEKSLEFNSIKELKDEAGI
jgi:antitoxin YefM